MDRDPSSAETVELALKGLSMPLVEAMESQRAIRRLLPDPVPDELVVRLIELAEKAPNGGNEQWFAFVVVKDPKVRWWQDRLTPTWKHVGGGCHLNRAIADLIEAAGFEFERLDTGYMRGPKPMTFMYEGCARPR